MRILPASLLTALVLGACANPAGPTSRSAWTVQKTARGIIATSGDWLVTGGNSDVNPGVVAGVSVYYKGEPIGGGGIYGFVFGDKVWNEWVPFLVPTRPAYSRLESFQARGDTLTLAFADSVPLTVYEGQEIVLRFDLRIVPHSLQLDFILGGMHMLFFPERTEETYTISCYSSDQAQDTTLVISYDSPTWQRDFTGPSHYELRSNHFDMDFETDAPLMKVGTGELGVGSGGLVKFDLDHSFNAVPPRYYVNSRLSVVAKF